MANLDIPFAMFAPKNVELEDNDPMVRLLQRYICPLSIPYANIYAILCLEYTLVLQKITSYSDFFGFTKSLVLNLGLSRHANNSMCLQPLL